MNFRDIKALLPISIPFILIYLSYKLFLKIQETQLVSYEAIRYSSYAVLLIGLVVSYFSNRNRVFFTLITLLLSQYLLVDKKLYLSVVYPAVCIFIPLNIIIFSFLTERGVLTPGGKNRIALIFVEIIFTATIFGTNNQPLINLINKKVFSLRILSQTPVPQIAILLLLAAILLLIIRQSKNISSYESSFAGVIVASFIALNFKENNLALVIFFSISSVILIFAIIQDLYRKAYLDELTGIPTRRALMEELMKIGGKYTIAMLDIDFFKKFNDTYGHDVGDNALKFVAAMMKNVTGGGKIYRYGGEEFTIIFPGKGVDDAVSHLEKLRGKISSRGFVLRGQDRPKKKPQKAKPNSSSAKRLFLTVSIGVSEKTEKNKTAADVIKSADNALYRAKENGRNCISK
ncbi:MAG: Response regulator PleD [Pelotomaculum sp. PtaU1.Bin065]|nr:MAG: Response regulator PleD [Pelotomaculum sp. PtaU1.Bin065]